MSFVYRSLIPRRGLRTIHIGHELIVIRHHGVRADVDREDAGELAQSLEHPLLTVRVIATRVLVKAQSQTRRTSRADDQPTPPYGRTITRVLR